MSDTETKTIEEQLADAKRQIEDLECDLDDTEKALGDATEVSADDRGPMSETLRDVVNSQLLALARAETEEAVHASVNAIHATLHRNDPPVPDVLDRLETILARPEVQPLVQMVVAQLMTAVFRGVPATPVAAATPPVPPPVGVIVNVLINGEHVGSVTANMPYDVDTLADLVLSDAALKARFLTQGPLTPVLRGNDILDFVTSP